MLLTARDKQLARMKRWRDKNKEKVREYAADYIRAAYAADPEKFKQQNAAYYQANKGKVRARTKRYAAENKEKVRAVKLAYQRANLHRWVDDARVRRARMRNAPEVERFAAMEIYERDGWVCGLCSLTVDPLDASIDHIIPLSRGGSHTRANVQTAHLRCNKKKGANYDGRVEWREEITVRCY